MTRQVISVLDDLEHSRFYGSLEMKFEAGKLVLLRKTETIKPENMGNRNTRGDDNVCQK